MKFFKYIVPLIFIFSTQVKSKCGGPNILMIDEPEALEAVSPSSIKVSMYDKILDGSNIEAYKTHAKNMGNLGYGAFDYEEIFFDKVENDNLKLCAHIAYGKLHETQTVGFDLAALNSFIRAKTFFEICPEEEIDKRFPWYDHICNFYPEDGEIIEMSNKNKGTKGNHSNAVVYSSAKFKDTNEKIYDCFGFGTLFNSNFPGYYTEAVYGYICSDQLDYFSNERIKNFAKSVGVYGLAEPNKNQRLEFHK